MGSNGVAVAEDVGNIVLLEHVNVTVPDQALAIQFYVVGLGLTRDPYLMVGLDNMWANTGEQQFHLPTRGAQVIPGHVGLVVPDLAQLQKRLQRVEQALAGTKFAWTAEAGYVAVTCPWGNQFRCYEPQEAFGSMALGIPYVEVLVRPGAAEGIARFYREVMRAPATVKRDGDTAVASVQVGVSQALNFRETTEALPAYDQHHIAVYVADFGAPYAYLEERELVTEVVRNHQFRFQKIVDPETGELLHELEHEVRGLNHPMFGRPFVNRDPGQSLGSYRRGQDALRVTV
jgi:catechol 2,3-dioxygenase-like lactoylglutathione lyase family enzyme